MKSQHRMRMPESLPVKTDVSHKKSTPKKSHTQIKTEQAALQTDTDARNKRVSGVSLGRDWLSSHICHDLGLTCESTQIDTHVCMHGKERSSKSHNQYFKHERKKKQSMSSSKTLTSLLLLAMITQQFSRSEDRAQFLWI